MGSRRMTCQILANPGHFAEARDRAAFFVRAAGLSAKQIGRAVGGSERTGQRIRDGQATGEQIAQLAGPLGWRFVHFVFEPLCGPAAVARDQEVIDDLTARLARIEAAVCSGPGESAPARRALAHGSGQQVADPEVTR